MEGNGWIGSEGKGLIGEAAGGQASNGVDRQGFDWRGWTVVDSMGGERIRSDWIALEKQDGIGTARS